MTGSNLFKYGEPAHGLVLFKHHDPLAFDLEQVGQGCVCECFPGMGLAVMDTSHRRVCGCKGGNRLCSTTGFILEQVRREGEEGRAV